ncbi:MAG: sodium/calcium exchanger protein [Eubacteriales bacterium]|nr:sodium/calcium exchanger protein [Eubacteriales bacterium]
MTKRTEQNTMWSAIGRFMVETPVASMLLKILELYVVSMGFSFVLTFIVGSGLAKIIYYRPTEVTYVTLFLSISGFFLLGAVFLRGFRSFCHSSREYLLIMLSAYSVYFFVSYWGLGLKFLPIDDSVLQMLPEWLYHGWSNQTFENVFLPLRIFAYYQWVPDWASLTAVHAMYITMIVIIAYSNGDRFAILRLAVDKIEFNAGAKSKSAKAKAKYERRRKKILRTNQELLDYADVDYNEEEYKEYLKDSFGEVDVETYPITEESVEVDNPNYEEEFDEYMKDAFDKGLDDEFPLEKIEFDNYQKEFDEYLKDAFEEEVNSNIQEEPGFNEKK